VTPTHHSSISAEFAANVKSDEQDSGKRAIALAQIPPNGSQINCSLPECSDLLSKQPFYCSEKSVSLSASKVVITSFSGSHSPQGTKSKKSKNEDLKPYYQEVIESLKVDRDNVHSLTGPTEQDWLEYFEKETRKKKNNKRKTNYSRKKNIKPVKCDARAGVSNIEKRGGVQTIFAD